MSDLWSVYLIRCGDNSLYTGISNDVPKRFKVHQSGGDRAAKYTRNRHPLQLIFCCTSSWLSIPTPISLMPAPIQS